jgi:hypothetical protein
VANEIGFSHTHLAVKQDRPKISKRVFSLLSILSQHVRPPDVGCQRCMHLRILVSFSRVRQQRPVCLEKPVEGMSESCFQLLAT